MSQTVEELCTLLVEDNFGELFGRIFSLLVRYDRLPLARLKPLARVPDRQLYSALAAMIQMNLVYHFTSFEDGLTYYEANIRAAYNLVRAGKILHMIEQRLGSYAARVVSTILYLGHAQVRYLEKLPELRPAENKGANGVNGVGADDEDAVDGHEKDTAEEQLPNGDYDENHSGNERLYSTLTTLAAHGYIKRFREADFHSPADNVLDAERTVKAMIAGSGLKGKKLEAEIQERTEKLVAERTDGDLTKGLLRDGIPVGAKRRQQNEEGTGPNKRPRLESEEAEDEWATYEDDDEVMPGNAITPDLVVGINYEKMNVVSRNAHLVELAERAWSHETAKVYETLLRLIEYQTKRCRTQEELPREGEEGVDYSAAIPLYKIANELDPHLDLSNTIGPMEPSAVPNRRGKRPLENGVNGRGPDGDGDDDEPSNRTHDVDQHLQLVSQPPYSLASRKLHQGIPSWTVEFRHVARTLRHLELERLIAHRFGNTALRVARILQDKGKLDEKRLQELSLLSSKDLRQVLASMQAAGFVDLLELPRDAQRHPSRTIYLWFYDPDRVARNVLHDTYKAMSRVLQRIRFERERLKDFLEKTERIDVKGNEDKYLTDVERLTLRQWQEKEALLLGEVARLDDLVAVLRDY